MKIHWKKEVFLLAITIAPIMFLLFMPDIPSDIPVHWNIHGEIDRYGSKYILPISGIGVYLLLFLAPLIDPRRQNHILHNDRLYKIRFAIVLFITLINIILLLTASGMKFQVPRSVSILVFFLFAVLGNYLNNIKSNWFIGIRTPWTLSNERVWRKTHFFSGRLWFLSGLAGLIVAFFIDLRHLGYFLIFFCGIISIIPLIYSYLIYRKEIQNQ